MCFHLTLSSLYLIPSLYYWCEWLHPNKSMFQQLTVHSVCVCAYVCARVRVCVRVSMHVEAKRLMLSVFFNHPPSYLFACLFIYF